jgi:manganese efflux pump family protein
MVRGADSLDGMESASGVCTLCSQSNLGVVILEPLPLLAIAFGLAMDAFSVAVASGLTLGGVSPRQTFRLSFHFGLFQFLMPVVGWLAGTTVEQLISSYDHWIAFILLAYVGGKMIWESLDRDGEQIKGDPTKGATLVMLSFATSIDALAIGLSMALLRVPVLVPAVIIGIVAASMTFLGLRIGKHAGHLLGPWMERLGGLVLLAIGLKIVLEHTLG